MDRAATTIPLTACALLGFAANSILCRLALGGGAIDAVSFTTIRIASGALALFALTRLGGRPRVVESGSDWLSAFCLVAYALCFSLAYLRIGAALGALILFGAVQATMFGWSALRGSHPRPLEWVGLVIAFCGLAWLTVPGASAPDPLGFAAMAAAGVAWGAYSLRGRGSRFPLAATAGNFARGTVWVAGALVVGFASLHASPKGVALAIASGVVASGLGYAAWYRVLPALGATRAAVLQLLVPVLAAALAFPLLGESANRRLLVAASLILGGVMVALVARGRAESTEAAAPLAGRE
ncbi:MAG: DMT family transporter [Planctomycetes bacterium]|nr:DMT family transporter [Planctomycetota bacterium]